MAAPMATLEKKCALCLSPLKGRSYRNINSKTSIEQYGAIFQKLKVSCNGLCCNICVNKLNRNRICTLDNEEKARISKIRVERDQLYQKLNDLPGVAVRQTNQNVTPRGTKSTKRTFEVDSSPTGLTPKSKKSLFLSPKKIVTPDRGKLFTAQTHKTPSKLYVQPEKVDAATETKIARKRFDVKVTVMYNNSERSKIITDKVEQSAIKAMMSNNGHNTVMKHLSKSVSYKASMVKCVSKEIIKEVSKLSKRSQTDFRVKFTEDLMNFKWEEQAIIIQQKMPTLASILNSVMGGKMQKSTARLVVAISVLLYARCQLLNHLQFILGLILDSCGLNKEGLNIMHDLGLAVSYTSIHKKRRGLIKKQEENIKSVVKQFVEQKCQALENSVVDSDTVNNGTEAYQAGLHSDVQKIEILGDNFDITISPAHMTMEKQRKSLHWFLTMVKTRRVTYEDLHMSGPEPRQPDILEIPSNQWIPSQTQMDAVQQNFVFHISHVLLKYINGLQPVKAAYPEHILHPFTELTQGKSVILNCDLIDSSENSSEGMITILKKVHELAVPFAHDEILQRVVFGGDVLTNERVFSAQQAMQNNKKDFDCLFGVIHRPEGLHRQFNFLLVIQELAVETVLV